MEGHDGRLGWKVEMEVEVSVAGEPRVNEGQKQGFGLRSPDASAPARWSVREGGAGSLLAL